MIKLGQGLNEDTYIGGRGLFNAELTGEAGLCLRIEDTKPEPTGIWKRLELQYFGGVLR